MYVHKVYFSHCQHKPLLSTSKIENNAKSVCAYVLKAEVYTHGYAHFTLNCFTSVLFTK